MFAPAACANSQFGVRWTETLFADPRTAPCSLRRTRLDPRPTGFQPLRTDNVASMKKLSCSMLSTRWNNTPFTTSQSKDRGRQDHGQVDDMVTGTPPLFKRGLVSFPRVQAGLIPLSSVVPPRVRSLLEDDATSPLLQRDCAERSEGRLAFVARLRGNPRLYGRFLGDLFAKGLITMVAPFLVPKKDGCQRLIFDTREANHNPAPPPYTPLAGSQSLSSLQLPPGTAFQGPG